MHKRRCSDRICSEVPRAGERAMRIRVGRVMSDVCDRRRRNADSVSGDFRANASARPRDRARMGADFEAARYSWHARPAWRLRWPGGDRSSPGGAPAEIGIASIPIVRPDEIDATVIRRVGLRARAGVRRRPEIAVTTTSLAPVPADRISGGLSGGIGVTAAGLGPVPAGSIKGSSRSGRPVPAGAMLGKARGRRHADQQHSSETA